MNDLFSEPHQADERTQSAGDHEATLQTVREEVVSAGGQKRVLNQQTTLKRPQKPGDHGACLRREHVQRQRQERAHGACKETLVDATCKKKKKSDQTD